MKLADQYNKESYPTTNNTAEQIDDAIGFYGPISDDKVTTINLMLETLSGYEHGNADTEDVAPDLTLIQYASVVYDLALVVVHT